MQLSQLNELPHTELTAVLSQCCGASQWVKAMVHFQPYASKEILHEISDTIWSELGDEDYLEAFTHHPMIGDLDALKQKFADTAQWAGQEQSGSNAASDATLLALQQGNQDYLAKFGFIFIVCATGKSAAQMLSMLRERLENDRSSELTIAASEQNKITHLRLNKLLED